MFTKGFPARNADPIMLVCSLLAVRIPTCMHHQARAPEPMERPLQTPKLRLIVGVPTRTVAPILHTSTPHPSTLSPHPHTHAPAPALPSPAPRADQSPTPQWAGWLLFCVGFGMEMDSSERLDGFERTVEKFTWCAPPSSPFLPSLASRGLACRYVFCVVGLLAVGTMVYYTLHKPPGLLPIGLGLSAFALAMVGGPLDETGHFLWDCGEEDEYGETFTGPGCQEETYSNMSMMFAGALLYATSMAVVLYVCTLAPSTKFTLKLGRSDLHAPLGN